MGEVDLYKTLGVSKRAKAETIKQAYRKLAMQHHPDKNPGDEAAAETFKEVQFAFDVLSNDERRARYDATGETGMPKDGTNEVLAVVSEAMHKLLSDMIGQGIDPEAADMQKAMLDLFREERRELRRRADDGKKLADRLRAVSKRFTTKEPDNLLASMALGPVAAIERKAKEDARKAAICDEAIAMIGKFQYKAKANGQSPEWLVFSEATA